MGATTLIIGLTLFVTGLIMPAPHPKHLKSGADTLCWTASKRLSWSDFRAVNTADTLAKAKASVILSYYVWHPDPFSPRTETNVLTLINRDASWSNPKFRDPNLLSREQMHFDIMELYARKMRRAAAEYNTGFRARHKSEKVLGALYAQAEQMCLRFDSESAQGTNAFVRAQWEKTTRLQLNELSAYAHQVPDEE